MSTPSARTTAVTTVSSTIADWSAGLAEPVPNPGGGAAGGVVLATAAALVSMVGGYSTGRGEEGEPEAIVARTQAMRRESLRLADLDGTASESLAHAYRLPETAERDRAIRAESVAAAELCTTMATQAIALIPDIERLAAIGNPVLIADVVVAATLTRSALVTFRTNIGVDLAGLVALGDPLQDVADAHPSSWRALHDIDGAIARIDVLQSALDERVLPHRR